MRKSLSCPKPAGQQRQSSQVRLFRYNDAETTTKKSQNEILWETRYQELIDFCTEHGHCRVPIRYKDNLSLGCWVGRQRQDYRKRKEGKVSPMADDRINLLEKIGFVWNALESTWMARYNELKQFQESHGHCNVPRDYSANKELGLWVSNQRTQYRLRQEGNQSSTMTNERISMLEEIGFIWDAQKSAWMTRYEELIEFKQRHGHCNVPSDYSANKELGQWVHTQRKQYRLLQEGKQSSQMTNERISMLEEIGFIWDAQESAWMTRYEELIGFKQRHGHCNVPSDYSANKGLGQWVHTQRTQYRLQQESNQSSSMTNERISMLEEIGFVWDALEDAWMQRYQELVEYKRRRGRFPRIKKLDPSALMSWMFNQRNQLFWWMQGNTPWSLTIERLKMLYDIGFFDEDDREVLEWVRNYLEKNNDEMNKKDDG